MSLSLKHIPCPAGNTCTAFHCIFGHTRDKEHGNNAASQRLASSTDVAPTSLDEALQDDDLPRKRQKVDLPGHASFSKGTGSSKEINSPSAGSRYSAETTVTQGLAAHRLHTATRPVSPPPLKRPLSEIKDQQSPKDSSPKANQTSQAPKKTETLNPRLIKSAPAKHDIRLRLVKALFQELKRLNTDLDKSGNDEELKLVLSEQELIRRTLDDEQNVAVQQAAVYSNVMKNRVFQYKRMTTAQWKSERSKEVAPQKKRAGADASDEPKKIETGLTSAQEVLLLPSLLTPIDKLTNHGYVANVPSDESVDKARQGLEAAKGWEKCDRCQQRFQVFPGRREEDGALTSGGTCKFHWGKTYVPEKTPGATSRVPKRYRCCDEEIGESAGCFTRDHHVYKASDPKRLSAILNFVETPENPLVSTDRGVCFDCEMCYTVHGLELVRLTATSWPTGEELLDVLVHPIGEILDLNSRFSGVWPEDMAQAEPWSAGGPQPPNSGMESVSKEGEFPSKKKLKIVSSPEVARDLLFSLLSPSTPLIGHGLENDLNAVRIVHHTVIDTVLLYPHRAGLPFRNGLKTLMDVHLNRKIQQEIGPKMLGHDSAEDARAAGDLVRLKVAQEWKDMQLVGWKVEGGELVAPVKNGSNGALTEGFIES